MAHGLDELRCAQELDLLGFTVTPYDCTLEYTQRIAGDSGQAVVQGSLSAITEFVFVEYSGQ